MSWKVLDIGSETGRSSAMATEPRILVVEDDKNFRQVVAFALRSFGYEIATAVNGQEALEKIPEFKPDLVLCDLKMPVMGGMEFLSALGTQGIRIPVVVLTAFGTVESAVAAMRAGAFDYVTKPLNMDEVRMSIDRALQHERLCAENRVLRERVQGARAVDRLMGASDAMRELRGQLLRLAESDAVVLLRGESGVGKELAARALHYDGPRGTSGQFVVLNCAAIPGELLESELFGHRKGSFTGAFADREGKFQAADGGTLFLDEIGDMPSNLQAKLLRALQEGEIQRVGDNTTIRVRVRVVAATNQPLEEKIRAGSFRQDLYYRLSVVPVEIPPLRARLTDILLLARHFLAAYGSPGAEITSDATEKLLAHSWPGNVRELENVIQRACALRPGLKQLGSDDVGLVSGGFAPAADVSSLLTSVEFTLPAEGINFEELERKLLETAWVQSGRNQTRGARLLGLQRQAFIYRLQKYGIVSESGDDA